jgi:hypothetical protein
MIGVSGDPVIADGFGSDASDETDGHAAPPPFVDLDADQDAADADAE